MAFVLENEFSALALDATVQDTNTSLATIIARLALLADDASVDAVNTTLANTIHGDLAGLIAAVNDAEATLVTINTRAQMLSTEATLQAAVTAIEALGGDPVATEATLANLLAEAVLIKTSVDGLLTDAELRANPVNVAVTDFPATVAVTDVTEGAAADAAVDGDSPGTLSSKLRGLLKVVGTTLDAATASGTAGTLQSYTRRIRDQFDALINKLPAALVGGRLDVNVGNTPSVTQSPTGYNTPPGGPTFTLGALGTFFTVDTGLYGRWISIQLLSNPNGNTIAWEFSNDNVNWLPFPLVDHTAVAGSGVSTSSTASSLRGWAGPVPGQYVRVRLSAFNSNTTTIAVQFHGTPGTPLMEDVDTELPAAVALSDTAANPTAPAVGAFPHYFGGATWSRAYHAQAALDANSGSGFAPVGLFGYNGATWDRLRASIANGLAVDVTRQPTALEVIGTATSVAVLSNFPVDANRYRWVSVQISGTFVGTYIFEVSNDNLNWTPTAIVGSSQATPGVNATGSTVPGQFHGPINGRYFRVRCSAYTSGTITATVEFFAMPGAFNMMAVDTELPAAVALADSTSNPTAPSVGSFPHLWDTVASAWQRQRAVRSMSDGDAGGFTASVGLTAFNGASYDRLRTGPTTGALLAALAPSNYQTPPGGPSFSLSALGTFFTVDTSTMGRWMSVQMIANSSANSVTWEGSNDGGTTWRTFSLQEVAQSVNPASSTGSGANTFVGHVPFQQVRVRISSYIGGTTTIAVWFHAFAPAPMQTAVDTELPAASVLADATSNPTVPGVGAFPEVWDTVGTQWNRLRAGNNDGLGEQGLLGVVQMLHTGSNADRARTPNTFKSAIRIANGSGALWTPTTGKKFRIMRYKIIVSADAAFAVAGQLTIDLLDAAASIGLTHSVWIPGAAAGVNVADNYDTGWIDLGNGILSSTANNVLNLNNSGTLASGQVRCLVAGVEE